MPKRSKAAPVNYQVPFSTAQSDASRVGPSPGSEPEWGRNLYQPAVEAKIAMQNLKDFNQSLKEDLQDYGQYWRKSPLSAAKDVGQGVVDMMNPGPGIVEAGNAWGEFGAQPSWKGARSAALKTGMAGLDVGFALEGLGAARNLTKMARLGRF